jgi:Flavoprotein
LYLIASGAAPARELPALVTDLTRDWDTCVITTPEGSRFLDAGRIAEMTGHPVRTGFKDPDAPDILPQASAFAAAPAAFNTINKWAAGISDTLALGLLKEAIGLGLPITAPAFHDLRHSFALNNRGSPAVTTPARYCRSCKPTWGIPRSPAPATT